VERVEKEMTDRFGPCPDEVRVLIEIEQIRAMASILAIDEILEDSRSIRLRISGSSKVDVNRLVSLMAADRRLSIDPGDHETLIYVPESMDPEKKVPGLKKLLQQLV